MGESHMTIARLIAGRDQQIVHCSPQETVGEAARRLAENRIGAMPVVTHGEVIGIFSERDLVRCVADHGSGVLDWPVDRVMSSPVETVDPQTPILAALATMTQRRMRHLPVVEGGEIRGIVSIGDLVKHRIERIEAEAEALRTYIQSA